MKRQAYDSQAKGREEATKTITILCDADERARQMHKQGGLVGRTLTMTVQEACTYIEK